MKFIFNFMFFGLLFYVIWLYFPDAFHTLQSVAETVVAFIKEALNTISEKIRSSSNNP